MSGQPDQPVTIVADPTTGAVTAGDTYPLAKPSTKTVSLVWLGIVYANIAVMVIAAGALAGALFMPSRPSLAEPALMLTLFTTPAAFLAGLIARDPGRHS